MADDRVQQGKTLTQTAQNPGSPASMAKILGIAGEGLWDFASHAYDWMVPQSVEELALEGSPVGKAIGLIPPKYIQPFVKRLRTMIENEKGWRPDVQQAAWEAVDRNPRIAAHVDEIRPFRRPQSENLSTQEMLETDFEIPNTVLGDYTGIDKSIRETATEDPAMMATILRSRLENNRGPGFGSRIRLDPNKTTYGSIFEPPARVADHEFAHAAQDLWNPDAIGPNQRYQTYEYNVNPFEIGANASADPMGGDYWKRLERALNARGVKEAMGTPERAKMIRDMNRTMAGQNRTIVLDPKSSMLRIVLGK